MPVPIAAEKPKRARLNRDTIALIATSGCASVASQTGAGNGHVLEWRDL